MRNKDTENLSQLHVCVTELTLVFWRLNYSLPAGHLGRVQLGVALLNTTREEVARKQFEIFEATPCCLHNFVACSDLRCSPLYTFFYSIILLFRPVRRYKYKILLLLAIKNIYFFYAILPIRIALSPRVGVSLPLSNCTWFVRSLVSWSVAFLNDNRQLFPFSSHFFVALFPRVSTPYVPSLLNFTIRYAWHTKTAS